MICVLGSTQTVMYQITLKKIQQIEGSVVDMMLEHSSVEQMECWLLIISKLRRSGI